MHRFVVKRGGVLSFSRSNYRFVGKRGKVLGFVSCVLIVMDYTGLLESEGFVMCCYTITTVCTGLLKSEGVC